MKDVSEWKIYIDDVEGELAMTKRKCGGREIQVLAKEEIIEFLEREIEFHIKMLELDKKDGSTPEIPFRNGIISQTKALLATIR